MSRAARKVEFRDELLGLWRIGALAGLFPGKEFGVDQQSMFEIVDAEGGGFPKSDRTEMARDFGVTRCELLQRRR